MQTPSRTELPLVADSSGCGCCSTEARTAPPAEKGVEYGVEGLTCGGCVARVEKAVLSLDGVESAAVELVPGGVSRLVIAGPAELSAVREAVASAGYALTSS
ncbi:heavy-metal-associated domain-containing protein [Paenarthrobacter ureafaciens]|uniref:heavy-metal-associated domain-containing protein n=1 Tax=Paenarthrobacter ureafaciens TaxID=37931 RepID=UPI00140794E4|nr:heavy-metal-associated domain-containing protein [Paenarthrobacter ureafaciens]MCX8454837.1 heavy-metal-associated domain-containing protein [Paenarthrobacter ureafaciens]MCY0975582.1 heavy-metal-associated domain-containing protein [Paenarthrobacter ureafaciens]